jgi:hypothetical protein
MLRSLKVRKRAQNSYEGYPTTQNPKKLSKHQMNQSDQKYKKNVSRIRKKTFYLQFCMRTPEGHQKSIFNTPKVKRKTKIHMESIRQSLQTQPNNIKKLSKNQNNQSK